MSRESRLCLERPSTRRDFALGAGRLLAASSLLPAFRVADAVAAPRPLLPWLADIDGDGLVTPRDERLLRRAIESDRGFDVVPAPGYDYRADVLARGRIDQDDLVAFRQIRERLRGGAPPPRPITVGWHYGWYHKPKRTRQTTAYKGGDYLSSDPIVEADFHRLKNECGITVDALSWISPRKDPRTLQNYRRGYLSAAGLESRHVALLYESWISLPREGHRIDFASTDTRGRLVEDFGLMGAFFREAADRGARIFELDGRPVVFVFASHSWVDDVESDFQFRALDDAVEAAIERFAAETGVPPFIVGEEIPLAPDDEFTRDRARRGQNFDGLFVYHHVASPQNIIQGGRKLGHAYARKQERLLRKAIRASLDIRNRFTGNRPLLIPSLASGFAKNGMRKLRTTRISYANFMHEVMRFLDEEYYGLLDRVEKGRFPAPVYSVGSWNEEFEGHALFPFSFNRSLKRVRHDGFDLSLAVKEVFGWNQYAERPLP